MAFACHTLASCIFNRGALKSYQRNQTPQKKIDLFKIRKFLQHSGTDQPVVCMVVNDLRPEQRKKFVKTLGGKPFEKGIRLSGGAHAVYNFTAVKICIHHRIHGIDVILAICIDGNCYIAQVSCFHQPSQHSILMTSVTALRDAQKNLILFRQLLDNLPGGIFTAVIDKQYTAAR